MHLESKQNVIFRDSADLDVMLNNDSFSKIVPTKFLLLIKLIKKAGNCCTKKCHVIMFGIDIVKVRLEENNELLLVGWSMLAFWMVKDIF